MRNLPTITTPMSTCACALVNDFARRGADISAVYGASLYRGLPYVQGDLSMAGDAGQLVG
ncbi:MAG: hypothetical protein ACE366_01530 [Bradymonadia bacterium]